METAMMCRDLGNQPQTLSGCYRAPNGGYLGPNGGQCEDLGRAQSLIFFGTFSPQPTRV